ncbi:MAG: DUF58 domain-containing protein [Gammaproteobacteria bacterium]
MSDGIRASAQELIQLQSSARNIDLDSQRRAASAIANLRPSRLRGRGVDFAESRNYQPGDDIRHMDWRVTARTGRPHTKVFQEERERPIIVMVDFNPSMFFGTRVALKSVFAARLAALIGWAAIHKGDRIGAFLFGGRNHHDLSPAGGRGGALTLIRHLVSWSALDRSNITTEGVALSEALERLRRVVRPGSLVFILSDFYLLDAAVERHLARLRQHNDIVACQILDALELNPPPPGHYGITDGRAMRLIDTRSQGQREHYHAYFRERQRQVRELMRKRTVPLIAFATHEDGMETLRRGLAQPSVDLLAGNER